MKGELLLSSKTTPLKEYFDEQRSKKIPTRETPEEFLEVKQKFQEAKDNGTEILIENSELSAANSVVIQLEYVGNRWCMGYQHILYYGQDVKVPHTIHYSDVYGSQDGVTSRRRPVKVLLKGVNPFA